MKKFLVLGVSILLTLSLLTAVSNAEYVDSMDLDYVEYDHYGGSPNQCDYDGNCWDSNGFWYADPSYTGSDFIFGYPGSVDGWGNRWNNYGYLEDDVFYPYAETPEYAEYDEDSESQKVCDSDGNCWDNYGYWEDDIYYPYSDITEVDENWCADGMCDVDFLFWDVDPDDEYYSAVTYVGNAGVFDGYEDGSFDAYGDINRAEFLKVLVEFSGATPGSSYGDCFDDVGTEWFAPYVFYALGTSLDFILYENDLDENVTRGQMAEMIYNVL